jgi:hypothetical protein
MTALLLFLALLAFVLACIPRAAGFPWLPIGLGLWVLAELLGAGGLGALGD